MELVLPGARHAAGVRSCTPSALQREMNEFKICRRSVARIRYNDGSIARFCYQLSLPALWAGYAYIWYEFKSSLNMCVYSPFRQKGKTEKKQTDKDGQISYCTELAYTFTPPQKKKITVANFVTNRFSRDNCYQHSYTNRQIIAIKQI